MWCWRSRKKVNYADSVKNGEVLHTVKKERNALHTIQEGRPFVLDASYVGTAF
jgi:hypothetical protein